MEKRTHKKNDYQLFIAQAPARADGIVAGL